MRIDLEHQFFLPILGIAAYPVDASAARCLPHFQNRELSMDKLLGSDVHKIAFGRLIEALD